MKFFTILTTLFSFATMISTSAKNVVSVPELNLTNYEGHWHQVYGAPFDFTFQGYGKCITADYQIIGDNNVSVLNAQININNDLEEIGGYAFYKDLSKPGELSVMLEGVPTVAPYWVIKLGNVFDNMYRYSIVSVPQGPSLWVLARNISEFFEIYDNEVTEFLDMYGFKYVLIDQGC